ncbi:insulinase family protein [Bacteroides thetaiotaomicron]|uniref:Insulinase family protein n=2 Tax=Bacteroides TaxID=816 RepID=A0A414HTB3_BACT4|nr:insulinase family protein [Bacteroides thetaiotaomicron]RHD90800.1 insulinase family protein [Bacteroides thetaiotaomicron]RHJ69933.1 insulinase family protein [Bacteroides thetaiotaomicron]
MSKIPPQRISALFHVFKLFNSNHVIYNFIIYNLQISLFGAKVRKIPLPLFLSLKCCHNMNKLLKLSCLSLFLALVMSSCSSQKKYSYETVPNDPLKARIYTLDNGLKVYLTVNKETPRIQTFIAVRVGGKNDPAETTGLAHYFEHLMFKGTDKYGTQDYAAEKPLLDQIEQQFEIYRQTTDEAERKAIYHTIDSLSYEASKYAIPNEYDKLMAAIGSSGSNAYTWYDQTVYQEDIPSNQIENWAKIQADRFENNVIRGFHTELEAVYEEKNMSLTRDNSKVQEAIFSSLFPKHPYGTQTVLGTQENLKNPSITNIKNYYKQWYVPNNMAICMSGDLDPDETIALIDKYFGGLKPNPELPKLNLPKEDPITAPIVKEVLGPDAESVALAWRFPGLASKDFEVLQVVSQVLYNGKAGLIDLDLNQQQKVLNSYGYPMGLADYSAFILGGLPKQGQTLEEVKDLLLNEIKKLRAGEFDEKMLQANINNFKLYELQSMESNEGRADIFVNSFINGTNWEDEVTAIDRMAKLTKEDIVAFADKYLKEDNYAVVYKKQGKDPNEKKMTKPEITPIVSNRDVASPFLTSIQENAVKPIEPVFLDFKKDMSQLTAKSDIPVLYKQNTTNDLFQLIYVFDMGNNNDKALGTAFDYLEYLGTSDMTPEELKSEFYRLACTFYVSPGNERTYVVLSGLNENMPAAMQLFEKLLADAQVNKEAYNNLVGDILKARADAKLNQGQNFSRLMNYAMYGPKSPTTNLLTEAELASMNPQELVDRIHNQNNYKHRILYYGPSSSKDLLATIDQYHQVPATLKDIPAGNEFSYLETPATKVLVAPYEAKQIYMAQISNLDKKYDPAIEPTRELYNEYFGGGMNSIVFQEMRETRGLAYSAWAGIMPPSYLKYPYTIRTQIATQNDKMIDAVNTFNDIINNMPESEAAFKLAKEGLINRMRTDRIIKSDIIWTYINAQDLGQSVDPRIKLYNDVQTMTLKDIVDFQKEWVKGRTYVYCILGDKKDLDMNKLKAVGPIEELTQEQIFGY